MNCELNSIFDNDDVEVSTVSTEEENDTAGNAIAFNSLEDEEDFVNDIESHLIFNEERDVTYMAPIPKLGTPRDSSLTPITIMVVDTIGLKKSRALLKVLFDPGSTRTLISKSCLPRGTSLIPLEQAKEVKTLAGSMKTASMVHLRNLRLPEFDKNCRILRVLNDDLMENMKTEK